MSRELQKLHYPTAYSFSRDDIGRIVLFKSEKDLALYPFMIIFNAHQTSDTDDDILLKDVLTEGYKREDVYCTIISCMSLPHKGDELIQLIEVDYHNKQRLKNLQHEFRMLCPLEQDNK